MIKTQMGNYNRSVMIAVYETPYSLKSNVRSSLNTATGNIHSRVLMIIVLAHLNDFVIVTKYDYINPVNVGEIGGTCSTH
jgi:hypothetical protein